MAWSKQFKKAKIEEHPDYVVLTIYYSYYFILDYQEVFVLKTLQEAKTKLLAERSRDHLEVIDKDGKNKNLEMLS